MLVIFVADSNQALMHSTFQLGAFQAFTSFFSMQVNLGLCAFYFHIKEGTISPNWLLHQLHVANLSSCQNLGIGTTKQESRYVTESEPGTRGFEGCNHLNILDGHGSMEYAKCQEGSKMFRHEDGIESYHRNASCKQVFIQNSQLHNYWRRLQMLVIPLLVTSM